MAAQHPDEAALSDPVATINRAELNTALNRVVAGLRATVGVCDPPVVAVIGENSVYTVMAHVGSMYAGVSPVPVNPGLTVEEACYLVTDSRAAAIIAGPAT